MEGDSSAKASPPNKRGYLSYEKCTFCRKDKKKCSPKNRKWPGQKCTRCTHLGRECSGNVRATVDISTTPPSESTLTKQSDKSDDTLVEDQRHGLEDWETFRALSSQSSWITHIERVCASVQISESIYTVRLGRISIQPDLSEIRTLVSKEREAVRTATRKAMRSPGLNPMVKYALASILKSSSLRSYEAGPKPPGVDCFDSQEDIPALVQDLQESGDIGYAISVQESYLNGLGVETSEDGWRTELKRYHDMYQLFRSAFKPSVVEQSRLPPCLLNDCLPFLETTAVRQAAIKYLPCATAKDVFGRNLLHIALYSGYTSGIHELIGRLSKQELNAKDFFGRAPLHIAATFGLDYVVHWLLEAGVDLSPCESSRNLTPLQCAAAAGHETTVAIILAGLDAVRLSPRGTRATAPIHELQAACVFSWKNRHHRITRTLLPRLTATEQAALRAAMASASTANISEVNRSMAPVDTGSGYDFIPELARRWGSGSS